MMVTNEQIIYEGEWLRMTAIYDHGQWGLNPDVAKLNAPFMTREQIAGIALMLNNYLAETEGQGAP